MTDTRRTPPLSPLSKDECEALLARHHVGRIAFTFRDRVDIAPIHYVYFDGRIFGRTQLGAKVDVMAHHPWIAFEVDEMDAQSVWRSVVVRGRITFPDPEGPANERAQFALGVAALQEFAPDAFTEDDPMADRDLVFCIHINEMTGRKTNNGQGRQRSGDRTNG